MNLFASLGIKHSILMDSDENETQQIVNEFIENCKNTYTVNIDLFDKDLEDFLGIPTPPRKDLKPLNIMYQHKNESITEEKIAELRGKIESLIE
ncbi:hypothetical protein MQE35_08735 [Abyssalbus ytuae]|uniref:Uncharacterized protein n=2 Tax=Abyssalbus ytuae TaxID=2926907 RepID=A0A9E6ZRY2_9FLAO|nr:hypothetical protein [Abyssalbus ytuae]UOB19370.1 hypothetical protein MQE35_08735 [Abyssalbus ytuae]